MVLDNNRDPLLYGGQSTKVGGMWTLKYEIISPKLYELIINIELKRYTDMDLKNFYNHINMRINAVNRLLEDLILAYQSIKRHYEFV